MSWFYEGMISALAQLAIFSGFLILTAAALWSCQYLGISEGFAILSFYALMIVTVNLFFAWKSQSIGAKAKETIDVN
jgi:hypothetical protein